jgi:hypothetical protein
MCGVLLQMRVKGVEKGERLRPKEVVQLRVVVPLVAGYNYAAVIQRTPDLSVFRRHSRRSAWVFKISLRRLGWRPDGGRRSYSQRIRREAQQLDSAEIEESRGCLDKKEGLLADLQPAYAHVF